VIQLVRLGRVKPKRRSGATMDKSCQWICRGQWLELVTPCSAGMLPASTGRRPASRVWADGHPVGRGTCLVWTQSAVLVVGARRSLATLGRWCRRSSTMQPQTGDCLDPRSRHELERGRVPSPQSAILAGAGDVASSRLTSRWNTLHRPAPTTPSTDRAIEDKRGRSYDRSVHGHEGYCGDGAHGIVLGRNEPGEICGARATVAEDLVPDSTG
jgi:hypothetical protein